MLDYRESGTTSSSHPSCMFQGIPGPLFQTPWLRMPFTVVDLRRVQHGVRQPRRRWAVGSLVKQPQQVAQNRCWNWDLKTIRQCNTMIYNVRSSVWYIQINFNLNYISKVYKMDPYPGSMLLGLPFLPESSAPIVKKTSLSLKTSQARLFTMKLLEPSHTCSAAARWALLPQDALCQRLGKNCCNMMTS